MKIQKSAFPIFCISLGILTAVTSYGAPCDPCKLFPRGAQGILIKAEANGCKIVGNLALNCTGLNCLYPGLTQTDPKIQIPTRILNEGNAVFPGWKRDLNNPQVIFCARNSVPTYNCLPSGITCSVTNRNGNSCTLNCPTPWGDTWQSSPLYVQGTGCRSDTLTGTFEGARVIADSPYVSNAIRCEYSFPNISSSSGDVTKEVGFETNTITGAFIAPSSGPWNNSPSDPDSFRCSGDAKLCKFIAR